MIFINKVSASRVIMSNKTIHIKYRHREQRLWQFLISDFPSNKWWTSPCQFSSTSKQLLLFVFAWQSMEAERSHGSPGSLSWLFTRGSSSSLEASGRWSLPLRPVSEGCIDYWRSSSKLHVRQPRASGEETTTQIDKTESATNQLRTRTRFTDYHIPARL